jgi:hypothetical protein
MIPTLLPALERHGRLKLDQADRDRVLAISATTIDRLLGDIKVAAGQTETCRLLLGNSARGSDPHVRRLERPAAGLLRGRHGRTWRHVGGGLVYPDADNGRCRHGWTECLPLVTRDGSLVVEAINRAQSLFPWLLRGVDFDNDSAFMNDVVVPWCREQKLEVTRSLPTRRTTRRSSSRKTVRSCGA